MTDGHRSEILTAVSNATSDLPRSRPSSAALKRFEQLFQRNVDSVVGYFARRCQDPQAVADLTAETFGQAARGFVGFNPQQSSDRAWLLAIANQAFEHRCAQEAERDPGLPRNDHRQLEPQEIEELARRIEAERGRARMVARTAHLSTPERTAVELVDLEGLSARDAASALGISRLTFRHRLASARSRLQDDPQVSGPVDPLPSR
jgi:RNA polymerase sigma factor (sigma-70 family)